LAYNLRQITDSVKLVIIKYLPLLTNAAIRELAVAELGPGRLSEKHKYFELQRTNFINVLGTAISPLFCEPEIDCFQFIYLQLCLRIIEKSLRRTSG